MELMGGLSTEASTLAPTTGLLPWLTSATTASLMSVVVSMSSDPVEIQQRVITGSVLGSRDLDSTLMDTEARSSWAEILYTQRRKLPDPRVFAQKLASVFSAPPRRPESPSLPR